MRTETAAHEAAREELRRKEVILSRFRAVLQFGDGTDYPFQRDYVSKANAITSATKTQLALIEGVSGGPGQVIPEQGQAAGGGFVLRQTDKDLAVLQQIADPELELAGAIGAGDLALTLTGDYTGLPPVGTLEIETSETVERIRYSSYTAGGVFTLTTRGADGTTAAAHAAGDLVANGEQIRRGQRCSLYIGVDGTTEAELTANEWARTEVANVAMDETHGGFIVETVDIVLGLDREIFTAATATAPVALTGNPLTILLQVWLSTGTGDNGTYDVLDKDNGAGIPAELVDVAEIESIRDTYFSDVTFTFSITSPQNAKTWSETQILKVLNCYPVPQQDGKLSIKRYAIVE